MVRKAAKGRSADKGSGSGSAGGGWEKKSEYVWRDKGVTRKVEIKQP